MNQVSALTPLIGRERECERALQLIRADGTRLLTLTGTGGVGKTRLAMKLVESLAAEFLDGVVIAELAAVPDASLVTGTIAHEMSTEPQAAESVMQAIVRQVGDRSILLVLDNVEHVISAARDIATIIQSCPGLTVLATSRSALRIRGEQEFPIEPLDLPAVGQSLEDLAGNPAVALFLHHARAVLPGYELTAEDASTVADIVTRLDGLPLAIELAAARMRLLPPSALLDRLEPRLPLLTGGARDMPERLRTVKSAISWSYDLLGEDGRTLFRRLAVFADGITIDAVEAIGTTATAPGSSESAVLDGTVLDGLESLLEHALISRVQDAPEPRFRMLETVREFGIDELAASEEAEPIRQAHAAYFLRLAERAEPELDGAGQTEWLDRLAGDHGNLQVALTFFIENQRSAEALRMSSALWPYWSRRGYLTEGRDWLERSLALDAGLHPEMRAKAALRLGNVALDLADLERAEAMFSTSLDAQQGIANERGIAASTSALGLVALHRGDISRATWLFEDARSRYDEAGDSGDWAVVRHNLGRAALAAGDTRQAWKLLEEAATIRRESGDAHGLAYSILYLAEVALAERNAETAEQMLHEASRRFDAHGDYIGAAWATHDFGLLAILRDDPVTAETKFRDALSARLEQAERQGVAETLEAVAGIAIGAGSAGPGASLLASADAWRQTTGLARTVTEQTAFDRHLMSAETTLGQDAMMAATTAGRLQSLEHVAMALLSEPPFARTPEEPAPAHDYGLTPREREVLQLLVDGRSDREIADALYMSPRTVSWHVGHILGKFDVESRTAAAALAVRHGVV